MRNSKSIVFNSFLTVTVYEFSVGDVLYFLWLMEDFEYPKQLNEFALKHFDSLNNRSESVIVFSKPMQFKKLYEKQQQQITELFFEVNKAFFSKEQDEYAALGGRLFAESMTGYDMLKHLSSDVEVLTRFGHPNLLSYPYSFYQVVMENFNEANKS